MEFKGETAMEYKPHKTFKPGTDDVVFDERLKNYCLLWNEIASDPYRPTYHFCGQFGFTTPFDPNGLLYSGGRYHLFFIFQDHEGAHCWGHASTIDFVHWKMHKTALRPDPKLVGRRVYSGNCFFDLNGIPTAAFCGYDLGVCLASAHDEMLENWTLDENNPVIKIPEEGDRRRSKYNLYDADVWTEDGIYKMLVGGIVQTDDEKYDTAYLYTSEDLKKWDFKGEFYKPEPDWTNPHEDCACPDFFKLNDKYVLVCISHMYGARAYIGTYTDGGFTPEKHVRINHQGGCLFAPESMEYKGKRLLMIWATDCNFSDNPTTAHATCMALPRTAELDSDSNLKFAPVDTLASLEYNRRTIEFNRPGCENEILSKVFSGKTVKLRLGLKHRDSGVSGIKVLCSEDGAEETAVFVDWDQKTVNIDFSKSGIRGDQGSSTVILLDGTWKDSKKITCQSADLYGDRLGDISLDIYVDKSIVEVFTDNGPALAQRVYPAGSDSVYLRAIGKADDFNYAEICDMDAASQI